VNQTLGRIGKSIDGPVKVTHFARLLSRPEMLGLLREKVRVDLKGLPVALHYGCHYLKPAHVFEEPEDPEDPRSLHEVVEAVGARCLDYKGLKDCCGGAVLAFDEDTATSLSKQKLVNVKERGAKAMIVVCPFCSVMYDDGQKGIEKKFGLEIGIPVLYLPQLVGLALGIDPKALGLNLNTVKTKKILEEVLGS
jgi:heterodisulfide reductase subunit B